MELSNAASPATGSVTKRIARRVGSISTGAPRAAAKSRRGRASPRDTRLAWSRDLGEQDGWDEHARFMDSLVEDGFVVLGGPLAGEREVLHAVSAPSEEAVRERLAQDNWHQNGMLIIKSIEPWTILLDGRQA